MQWLLLFRAVVGVALGGTPTIVTLFAEFVPSPQRGRWLLLMQFSWTLGAAGRWRGGWLRSLAGREGREALGSCTWCCSQPLGNSSRLACGELHLAGKLPWSSTAAP